MRSRLLLLRAAGLAAFLLVGLLAIFPPFEVRGGDGSAAPSADLVVSADGELTAIDLGVATVGEALAAARVTLDDSDGVAIGGRFVAPNAPLPPQAGTEGPLVLEVRRAIPFVLIEDGVRRTVASSRPTVGAALEHLGIELRPEDVVVPATGAKLAREMRVSVKYARALVVRLPDREVGVLTQAATVETALDAAAIPLPEEYRLEPAPDVPVETGLEVNVVALGQTNEVESIAVSPGVVRELDPSLAPGEERAVEGTQGTLHREWRVSYENGAEVGRELVSEWYDPAPVDTIVYYGPQPTPTPVPTATPAPRRSSGGTGGVEQWRSLVCAYDWDCEYALLVIKCESNGNADSVNPAGPYVGLFQVHAGYGGNLYDPAVNIAAAYDLYTRSGWGPWPNCP